MFGAGQEEGVRPGTENVAYIVGLGKACEISAGNFDNNYQHMYDMREKILEGLLLSLKNIRVNTDLTNSLPNTLSIAFDKVDAHKLTSLISNEVFISTGSACHSGQTEISPVLKAMKIELLIAAGTVRISTGRHTTKEEIEFAIEAISRAVQKLS
jgi:cysteine desulfurase